MLLCCQALRKPVKSFQRKHRQQVKNDKEFVSEDDGEGQHYNPLFDTLSNNNWIEVDELIDFVRVPYDLCKALEGNNVSGFGSLWQTVINLQALWQYYSEDASSFDDNDDSYFASALKFGLEKLNTYWKKLIIKPRYSYYTIVTALRPRLCLSWFKSAWLDFDDWQKKADISFHKKFD